MVIPWDGWVCAAVYVAEGIKIIFFLILSFISGMSVGCIRPSYLVLLGIAVATLLFYAAYISTSPFVVRLPTPRSHHQLYNESLIMETSDSMQNHSAADVASSETPNKISTKNNSVNTGVSAAASPGKLNKPSNN